MVKDKSKRIKWHPEFWDIEKLKPYDKNPRIITELGLDTLGESFDEIGYAQLININTDGTILSGHARWMQLKREGETQVEVSVPDRKLTPKQEEAVVIRMNKNQAGTWDYEKLNLEFDKEDLIEFGFTEDELKFETPEIGGNEGLTDPDEVPDKLEKESVICEGMLIELGNHRLLCGDCTIKENVDLLMGGEKADMVFTDPPYGVSYTDKNEYLNSLGTSYRLTKRIENDHKTPEEMYEFWIKSFVNLFEHTKDKMSYYITAPQGGDLLLLLQSIRDSGFQLKHILCWVKNNHVLGRCDYHYKHEPIVYGWKQKLTHEFYGKGNKKFSTWDFPKPLKNDLHPTMKPVELIEETILNSCVDNGIVIDLFLGSGSTLIACEKTNRKCFGMEIDPHYVQIIIERWKKFTGKEAYIINDGKRIAYSDP